MGFNSAIRELIRDVAREEVRAALRAELPPASASAPPSDGKAPGAIPASGEPLARSEPTRGVRPQPPASPAEGGGLWNARQAAAFLGTSVSWVYHRAAEGTIPCVRLGHNLRFQPEALRAWVRGERGGGRVVALGK